MVEPWKGLARIDPGDPQTLAVCDRCGDLRNLADLRPQYQWAGRELVNKGILVCSKCWDDPSIQLTARRLDADPMPALDARPASFSIYEKNEYTLKPAGIGTRMFAAVSAMSAATTASFTLAPHFSSVSSMTARMMAGILMQASFSVLSSLSANLSIAPRVLLTEDGFDILTEDGIPITTEGS